MTADVTLTHRRLTRNEAQTLHELIRLTPNILGYLTPELERFRDVWVAEGDGVFAGACLSVDLPFGWTEIAVLYVVDSYRGGGIGGQLFEKACRTAESRGRHIFVISRTPSVLKMMRERGMPPRKDFLKAPLAVHIYNQKYMASWYRTVEMFRKIKMRRDGLPEFQYGMMRFPKPP